MNTIGNIRINAAVAYLDALRSDRRLTIVDEAVVDRVRFSNERVTGVEYLRGGAQHSVSAEVVVLCAGAYGTPEVLLRSGVGPADELHRLGIDVVADRPGVGRNLHDHPTAQLEFAGSAELAAVLAEFGRTQCIPEEQSMAKLRSPFSDGPFDLHVYPWVEPDATLASGWRVIVPVSQLRPRSRGTVTLRSADPTVSATIDPRFFSDEGGADLGSIEFGLRWVVDELCDGPLSPFLGDPLGTDARSLRGEQLRHWIRRTHTHYWHPAGTSRMGAAEDPSSVVNGKAAMLGVDGVHVADASVFPDIPRATPALPTVAAAERIASFLTT